MSKVRGQCSKPSPNMPDSFHFPPERLLNLISMTLCGQPFRPPGCPPPRTPLALPIPSSNIPPSSTEPIQAPQGSDVESKILCLKVLGSFSFSDQPLNEFVKEFILKYLQDEDPRIRLVATESICKIFCNDPVVYQVNGNSIKLVREVLEKLLEVGIGDPGKHNHLNS
jgi:serine/threonine-protein kinase mTOR